MNTRATISVKPVTLNDLYDITCITNNRLSNIYGVYKLLIQVIKVVLTDYSIQPSGVQAK